MLKKRTLQAALGLLLAPMIWGFAFVVVKDSLNYLPTPYILAFRFTISSVLLGAVLWKRMKKFCTRRIFLEGLILGTLIFLSYLVQTYGCLYTTASKNAFITAIYVVITPFLVWIMYKKRPDVYTWTASVLCIAGVALLSLTEGMGGMNIGDFLTLLCAFGYAIHIVLVNRYTQNHDPLVLTVLQLATAAAESWLTALLAGGPFPTEGLLRPGVFLGMLYLGIFSTMVCYILQNVCQKYLPATTASIILSLEAVFGTLFSIIFLKDVFTFRMIIGAVLIFASIILSETKLKFLPFGGPHNA